MKRALLTILIILWASTAGAAQLVLISERTAKPGQAVGDVVAILPDAPLSCDTMQMFRVVRITDVSDAQLEKALLLLGDITTRTSKYAWNVQTTETSMTLKDLKRCVAIKP